MNKKNSLKFNINIFWYIYIYNGDNKSYTFLNFIN